MNATLKVLCLTMHTEGGTVYAIADDGSVWGSASGRNSCLYETACRAWAGGYTGLRFDGGDSLTVDSVLAEFDPFAVPAKSRRRR